jgi:dihydrofolate synthase/folylpolyglutamate synthase
MYGMPHWPVRLGNKPIDLNLERVTFLLEKLGNPHLNLPPVIHITGTNGKGSTLAFLKSIFEASGKKVHRYTSPHLLRFNERIILAGEEISDDFLNQIIEHCRIVAEPFNLKLTLFEGITVAAFLAFSKIRADILLLEVGMGGRLDATNVIANPELTIITPISLDHTDFLGETIAKIAFEKAGIIKANTCCITAPQLDAAHQVIENVAQNLNAPLFSYEYDYIIKKNDFGFEFLSNKFTLKLPPPNLIGDHQYLNAGTAIAAIANLKNFKISEPHIIQGITTAIWPARLQLITSGKLATMLPPNWELWLDGAHNESGAQILSLWAEEKQDKSLYLICGMTKGRDSKNFFKYFTGKVNFVCGVLVESEPTSHSATHIANDATSIGLKSYAADSLNDAIKKLIEISSTASRILICGSLYLAGDVFIINEK